MSYWPILFKALLNQLKEKGLLKLVKKIKHKLKKIQ